jgi:uncharacterized protein (DUF885 family)
VVRATAPVFELAERLAQAQLADDPFLATMLGIRGFDGSVPDLSPPARQAWRDELVGVVARCDELESDAVDLDSTLLLGAVRDHAVRALGAADSRVAEFGVTTMPTGGLSAMLFVAARMSIIDAAGASAYLARCRGYATYLDQYTERLQAAARAGLQPVAPLVDTVVEQLRGLMANPDRDPLLAHRPPAGWDGAAAWRNDLGRVVRDEVRPAIGRHLDALVALLPRARPPDRAGLLHLPGGVAAYGCCIRDGTTLALDADEVHRLGLQELAEVEQRIGEIGERAFGVRDPSQVLARLRDDPSLSGPPGRGEAAMARAVAVIARAEHRLADVLRPPLPPPCTVEAMPAHLAASGAPPMYSPPARDGSRAGAYLFNLAHPGAAAGAALEAITFHETVPGHHTQFARLQQVPDLPLLLSAFPVVPHAEGWGLYAEQLADELDLYSDDVQRLGMLGARALRAARLVADTGIHARGWSRARALRFAIEHTAAPESFLSVEIDRYIAVPGQALGYLIGRRELLRLRTEAQARLGSAFDIRDFHAAVLDHGNLPLPVLSQVLQRWAESIDPPSRGQ